MRRLRYNRENRRTLLRKACRRMSENKEASDNGENDRTHEYQNNPDDEEIDVEMALLALSASRDVGGPMQDLDLNSLSHAEKRLLLEMMQQRLGVPLNRDDSNSGTEDDEMDSGERPVL